MKYIVSSLLFTTVALAFSPWVQSCECKKQSKNNCVTVSQRFEKAKNNCVTVSQRFEKANKEYNAGCRAGRSYVQGALSAYADGGSDAFNKGFSDCRYNVYRSLACEKKSEESIRKYTSCTRMK